MFLRKVVKNVFKTRSNILSYNDVVTLLAPSHRWLHYVSSLAPLRIVDGSITCRRWLHYGPSLAPLPTIASSITYHRWLRYES